MKVPITIASGTASPPRGWAEAIAQARQAIQAPRSVSIMERAPWYVIYALHVPYCLYLACRHGGLTLPTMANPGLDASGLTKESKAALFELLGPTGRAHFAPLIAVSAGPAVLNDSRRAMDAAGLSFPVVVKPDIGRRGFGVRIIADETVLASHLACFRPGVRLLIQRYVAGPGEAGIFYMRRPSQEHGRILSLTIKHFPELTGDGVSSLRQLILADSRARAFARLYFARNRRHLDEVPAAGERHRIVSIGNHVRGAAFEDASAEITPALERAFDGIAREIPGFFIGRFDVRYTTIEELKQARGFTIVEYNGASGEPTNIWDPRTSVAATYAGLLDHCRYLYEIGAENRARGAKPMGAIEIIRRHFEELALLRSYPYEE